MWRDRARAAILASRHVAREAHQSLADALVVGLDHPQGRDVVIQRVIGSQNRAPAEPWNGCFDADPTGPIAWRDGWDPNSRCLVGLVLAHGLVAGLFSPQLQGQALDALHYAIEAEERCARLPLTYTNVVASHGANLVVAGHFLSQDALGQRGRELLRALNEDREWRDGFVEHNSPTYGGITLLALRIAACVDPDLSHIVEATLHTMLRDWDPEMVQFIGPFMRSYGVSISDYVSVTAAALGADAPGVSADHAGDWGVAAIAAEYAHMGSKARSDAPPSSEVRLLRGVGELSRRILPGVASGGVVGLGAHWHPQTMSATVHTSSGFIALCDPCIDIGSWDEGMTVADAAMPGIACPDWLWGGLQRPSKMGVRVPPRLMWRSSGEVAITADGRLRVGAGILRADRPWQMGPPGFVTLPRETSAIHIESFSTGRPA